MERNKDGTLREVRTEGEVDSGVDDDECESSDVDEFAEENDAVIELSEMSDYEFRETIKWYQKKQLKK
jgi:hypothetical protein